MAKLAGGWTGMAGEVTGVAQAAERVGLSVSTLNKLRIYGGGPRFLKLGRAVRYRVDDLDAWLAGKIQTSTSDVDRG